MTSIEGFQFYEGEEEEELEFSALLLQTLTIDIQL
jgi:hypothetical protein